MEADTEQIRSTDQDDSCALYAWGNYFSPEFHVPNTRKMTRMSRVVSIKNSDIPEGHVFELDLTAAMILLVTTWKSAANVLVSES